MIQGYLGVSIPLESYFIDDDGNAIDLTSLTPRFLVLTKDGNVTSIAATVVDLYQMTADFTPTVTGETFIQAAIGAGATLRINDPTPYYVLAPFTPT
jgi:hypothetical protein